MKRVEHARKQEETKQSAFREFSKYTLLNVLGMLGLSCYILADTFFVAKGLGANGLTALNLAIPVYSFIHGSGLMLGMGGGTRYSIQRGRGSSLQGDTIFTNVMYFAMGFSVMFVMLGVFCSEGITRLLGADEAVQNMTRIYLQMLLIFSPAFMCNDILNCFVRNDGAPYLAMKAMLAGSISNILLDYVFIFGFRWGMFGAVFATCLAPMIGIGVLSGHVRRGSHGFHLRRLRPQLKTMYSSAFLGISAGITEVASGLVMIVFNGIILGICGNIGVAAYGVIANLSLVVMSIYTGIAQGMQPIVSRARGEGDERRQRQSLYYGLAMELIFSVVIYVMMVLFASPIVTLFNEEGNLQLQQIAKAGMVLYFAGIPFAGGNIVLSAFFAATEKGLSAQVISLLRGVVLIVPMIFVLSAVWNMTGVWLAFPVTELIISLLGVYLYLRGNAFLRCRTGKTGL